MLVWNAYTRALDALAFSPCGRTLAVGGCHLSCLLLDPATGKAVCKKVTGKQAEGLSLAFAPDGLLLCRCGPLSVRSATDGTELRRFGNWCRAFALAADGASTFVADGGRQELVRRYDLDTGDALEQVSLDVGAIRRVAASPNGKTVAVAGTRRLTLLTAEGFEPVTSVAHRALSAGTFALTYSPCGRVLVFTAGRTLFALNARTGRELARAEADPKAKHFTDAAFTPTGRRLMTAGKDGTVRVWDTVRWSCERVLGWDVGPLRAVAVDPDGHRGAVAGDAGRVVVWDLD